MTDVRFVLFSLALALTASGACSTQPAASAAPQPGASAAAPAADAGVRTVTGTVLETENAKSYTYVRIDTGSEELWVASAQFPVAVGDRVAVALEMPMQNFHSDALNRDFPLIYFASTISKEGQSPPPMAPVPGHPPTGAGAPGPGVQTVSEPISPPAGGMGVADVWAGRTSLAGKTVTVRGKVVKFNGGIMGRNWLHIQDGSGKADEGTHDLTVTTAASASVGDIVTVTGVVAVDKDFGAGYTYAVILEDASVAPK